MARMLKPHALLFFFAPLEKYNLALREVLELAQHMLRHEDGARDTRTSPASVAMEAAAVAAGNALEAAVVDNEIGPQVHLLSAGKVGMVLECEILVDMVLVVVPPS